MPNQVTVLSPATVANMVCGFDVLGFALENPTDKLTVRKTKIPGITIINIDDYNLPLIPEQNVIGGALLAMLDEISEEIGFEVESTKSIMPGSGIGSSAASAAGAVVASNLLLEKPFSRHDLIRFAMEGERVASGARHADNIAPAIYGGVTLIRSTNPLDIVSIPAPVLYATILHPQIEIRTSNAREILKKEILLKDAVIQWGNVAGLVAGLMKGDYELISRSLVDVIVEPVRSILIPLFAEIKIKSLEAGALGGGISGSGPSVFMLSRDLETALAVEKSIKETYAEINVEFHTHVSAINTEGVKVINLI